MYFGRVCFFPMCLQTVLGGCLSLLFIMVAVIFSVISFVQVGINNVDERQNLIPNSIVLDSVHADMTFTVVCKCCVCLLMIDNSSRMSDLLRCHCKDTLARVSTTLELLEGTESTLHLLHVLVESQHW